MGVFGMLAPSAVVYQKAEKSSGLGKSIKIDGATKG
jgi:hypothetical protein